jgi:hypothetical protein
MTVTPEGFVTETAEERMARTGLQSHNKVVVYHKTDGAVEMAPIDANAAVQGHPAEWSRTPWKPSQAGHGKTRRVPAGGSHHEGP